MGWDAAEIERIVRQVVARMQGEPAAVPAAVATGLVLESKVVSLAQLDGRLGEARQITVRRDAVITPAARDWLREKQIAVHVAEVTELKSTHTRLIVGLAETQFEPSAMLRAAGQSSAQRVASAGLTSVVDELCDHVAKGGGLGLLFTARRPRPCAWRIDSAECGPSKPTICIRWKRECRKFGANLLVLNPTGFGTMALRRIVEQFCDAGHGCPEGLRKYLG